MPPAPIRVAFYNENSMSMEKIQIFYTYIYLYQTNICCVG